MYDRTGNYLIVAILIGMILGVITVAIFGEAMISVKFLGTMFLNALKMIVIPLLFCSMIVGISKLGDVRKLGRTGLKTMSYFLVTSSIAVVIGLILVNVIQPGVGFGLFGAGLPEAAQARESYSFFTWLTDQIPSSIVGAAAETQVLPIIIFALFFGGVLTTIGAKGKPVIAFFEGVNEAIMKIVHLIMWFAPIGIFGLVAGQLAAHGGMSGFSSVLSALGKYSLVVILGLLIHGVIVLPLLLKFIGGKNPIEYFVGMSQALMTAFATASSSATLPVSMDCVEERNDVDKRASSFVLPLGATINMDGTALYEAVAAMFIAQAYGIDLSILSQIVIFATAVLASIGAAGIPEAGLVTMVLVLTAVGLPLEGIGLILAIDWFLDRCRTTVNVWGDSIGAAVIATTAEIGLVDRSRFKTAKSGRLDRFRGLTRRKDPRYKKKTQDKSGGPARERISVKGTKGKVSTRETTRRTAPKPTKKTSRIEDKRTFRKDQREAKPPKGNRREAYKPHEEVSKEKVSKPRPTKTVKAVNGDKKPVAIQNQRKPGYGRKRVRPNHSREIPSKTDAKRSKPDSVIAEKSVEQVIDQQLKPGYEVPKFPATILDDLVSAEKEAETIKHDSDFGGKNGSPDSGSKPQEPVLESEGDSPAHDDIVTPVETSHVDETPTTNGGQEADESASDDFSRLDEAVLGYPDEVDMPGEESSSIADVKDSSSSPDKEPPQALPSDDSAVAADMDIPETSPEPPDNDAATPDIEHPDKDVSISATLSETTATKNELKSPGSDSGNNNRNGQAPEPEVVQEAEASSDITEEPQPAAGNEKIVEETSETKESPDVSSTDDDATKNDSMKWGRQKRKRPSR